MYKLLRILLYIPLQILLPTRVIGKKNIDKDGKMIIACNHLTYFDVILLCLHINRKICFMAKKELKKSWFLKWIFKKMNVITVDRDNLELSTVKEVLGVLKSGKVLGIFPEGTRNKTKELLLPFKEGVTLFAEKTGAPVVPIVIKRKPRFFVPNKITIGEKMFFEKGNENNTQILRDKMIEMKLEELNKNGRINTRND